MESQRISLYEITPNELKQFINEILEKKFKNFQPSTSVNSKEELMTVDETIVFLKCSKQALWNWRKNGILPSYRLGNRVYYKKKDILAKLVKQ